jgi:tetratricopeptide (TPR) repeat protein
MTPQYKTVQGIFDQIRKFEGQILIRTTQEDSMQEDYLKASLAFRQKNYALALKSLESVERYIAKKGMNYFFEQNNTLPGWVMILKANIMAGSRRSAESLQILDRVLRLYPNKIDEKLSNQMHANDMNMIYWLVRAQIEGTKKARQVESSVDEALRKAKGN